MGIHTACCGPNMWEITGASGQVFINGAQLVRQGDPTKHCGGPGFMIEASGNVQDGSPMIKGMAGANPILNNRAINAAAGQPGSGTDPSALRQIENRAAQFAGELGTEAAKGLGPAGVEAMEKVIDQKVVKFAEGKGIPIPSGAKTAAKVLKYGGWAAEFGIGVVPDIVRGDTHDAIKDTVATTAGIAAGSGCEAVTGVETFGLSTPACFATGTAVNWAVGKAYDPVVHFIGGIFG